MILDIRMQLDINIESRRIPRPEDDNNDDDDDDRDVNNGDAGSSNDSYITA